MSEKEIIFAALWQWANRLETGDSCVSAKAATKTDLAFMINPLSKDQIEFVKRIKEIAYSVLED